MPVLHAHLGFILARAVLEATDLGVFEAAKDGPLSLESLAARCELNPRALENLMTVLCAAGYFERAGERFGLTAMTRKWVLRDSPQSLHDLFVFDNRVCWAWMDSLRDYLKTGQGLQYHDSFNEAEWGYYQKAMRAGASMDTAEVARKTPFPSNPVHMLDIGGSHGLHSAAFCGKYPQLRATILDLPAAVEKASPLLSERLAAEGLADRIDYWPADALTTDLGEAVYDLVFMSSLAHHFSFEQNQALAVKVAKALKPGGHFVIQEFIRPDKPNGDLIGAIGDLFFGLSSTAGNWSLAEIRAWQDAAGLKHLKLVKFLTLPGQAQIVGCKP
jgi:SAM-dependent methyltransferase